MTLYQNKYRSETTRLLSWDYSNAASYFVTICTYERQPWFGQIAQGSMLLSDIGLYTQSEWLKSPELRPEMNLTFDEFVVMPDHFHGIITIGDNCYNQTGNDKTNDAADRKPNQRPCNQFGPQSKNLASIIRGFKSSVTVQARKLNPDFRWQDRYYDHIIRDQASLIRIRQYIVDNPLKWKPD